jgi:hypothetical protein
LNAENIARNGLIDGLLSGWSMVRSYPGALMVQGFWQEFPRSLRQKLCEHWEAVNMSFSPLIFMAEVREVEVRESE